MKLPRYVYPLSAVGTAVGIFVIVKDSTGGKKFTGDVKIPGRTAIVTGATSGIGKETAKELAKREARVILACRNLTKCEEVRSNIVEETFNRNVQCVELDLSSIKSVQKFAEMINKNEKRVDILVNNAGVLEETRSITQDGFETHMGVNYLGPFLLTNLLLDKLSASAPSRVVNVIGIGYNRVPLGFTDFNLDNTYKAADAYKRSKLALAIFTGELSKRLQDKGVTVYGVHPGVVDTNLRKSGGVVVKPLWTSFCRTPVQGAQTTLYCALEPTVLQHTGHLFACRRCQTAPREDPLAIEIIKECRDYFNFRSPSVTLVERRLNDCKKVETDPIALNEEKAKRLWAISERWTRLLE